MRRLIVSLLAAGLISAVSFGYVDAKNSGGGSSFSSSSGRSSSYGSSRGSGSSFWGKPSSGSSSSTGSWGKPSSPSPSPTSSSSGWGKPGQSSSGGSSTSAASWGKPSAPVSASFAAVSPVSKPLAPAVTRVPVKSSALDANLTRSRAADAFKAREAAVQAARAKPEVQAATAGKTFTSDSINTTRTTYVTRYRTIYHTDPIIWSHPPYYHSIYSDLYWASVVNDAAWWYNHQQDEEARRWREMALQSDNADLKAKLAKLDADVAAMRAQPTAPDPNPNYQPKDMPTEVMYSDDVLTGKSAPPLVVGTGSATGVYFAACDGDQALGLSGLQSFIGDAAKVSCVLTEGSGDNLSGLGTKFDGVWVQSDVLDRWEETHGTLPNVTPAYKELFWLVVNKDSDVSDVDSLKADDTVILPGENSGAAITWATLASHAKTLGWVSDSDNKTFAAMPKRHMPLLDAVSVVARDKHSVVFATMGLRSEAMQQVASRFGKQVKLVPVYDKSFARITGHDGNALYTSCSVPGGTYPDLQPGWLTTSVDTLCVDSLFVLASDAKPELAQAVLSALGPALREVRQAMGEQE